MRSEESQKTIPPSPIILDSQAEIVDSIFDHPKYAQYFKKRTCVKYVVDPK